MEFRLLGPLEVADSGRAVNLCGRRQRSVLAVLLLHANRRVSTDRLIDDVWDSRPPAKATQSVQSYISRLRRLLGDGAEIVAHGEGYLMSVDASRLDFVQFRALVERGHEALGKADYELASGLLAEALALWRGEPLADLVGASFVRDAAGEWSELWSMAVADRIEADVEQGLAEAVIGELETLVARYPDGERFRALLMRALYLAGRQVEALAVYRDAREALVSRLGLEPSPHLRELERAVLAHDESLAARAARESDRPADEGGDGSLMVCGWSARRPGPGGGRGDSGHRPTDRHGGNARGFSRLRCASRPRRYRRRTCRI